MSLPNLTRRPPPGVAPGAAFREVRSRSCRRATSWATSAAQAWARAGALAPPLESAHIAAIALHVLSRVARLSFRGSNPSFPPRALTTVVLHSRKVFHRTYLVAALVCSARRHTARQRAGVRNDHAAPTRGVAREAAQRRARHGSHVTRGNASKAILPPEFTSRSPPPSRVVGHLGALRPARGLGRRPRAPPDAAGCTNVAWKGAGGTRAAPWETVKRAAGL